MDNEEKHKPVIPTGVVFLVGAWCVLIDFIEIILLLFLLDDFWIGDLLTVPVTIYCLYLQFFKGLPSSRFLINWVLELIPWVGDLPLLTIGWVLLVIFDRNPKLAKVAAVVSPKSSGSAVAAGEKGAAMAAQEAKRLEGASTAALAQTESKGVSSLEGAAGKTSMEGGIKEATLASEALGEQREPWEKVSDIMKEIPEPERREKDEDDEPEEYRQAA